MTSPPMIPIGFSSSQYDPPRTRRPNRFHLLHRIVLRMHERGWPFTTEDVLKAIYVGRKIHPQQRKRAEQILFRYTEAGLLRVSKMGKRGHCQFTPSEVAEPSDRQERLRDELMKKWPPEELSPSDQLHLAMADYFLEGLV